MRRVSVLLGLLLARAAAAADYDPGLRWRTLQTEHFRVLFHDGEAALARDMATRAEQAFAALAPTVGDVPAERVELVLVDWTDDANGYATVVPRNTIVVFVTAPTPDSSLGFYENWNEGIVTHELTHILHIDTVGGLPRLARTLLGRIVSTHQASPGWIVEGYATFEETRFTSAGRGRSAVVDMLKRAAVLEDRFPPLGNLDGFQSRPPGGQLRYLWGQDFLRWIADHAGEDAWRAWVDAYGRGLPYLLPARRLFGGSFAELHAAWRADAEATARAQADAIRAEGTTEPRWLTPPGRACGNAAWKPGTSTTLAVGCSDPREGTHTWEIHTDATPSRRLVKGLTARRVAWRPDGKALAVVRTHAVRVYNRFDDVYLYDLAARSLRPLTRDARATDPAFSADGERVYVVQNALQDTRVARVSADQRLLPVLGNPDFGAPREDQAPRPIHLAGPAPSPDGRLLAVSAWRDGLRDLWLTTADGAPVARLTADAAIDRDPAWSADGAWLYFSSDRGGKPDIYALEVATRDLWRVTNVLTGAWGPAPSPDGTQLALTVHGTDGARVGVIPIDRSRWTPQGRLPDLAGDTPLPSPAADAARPAPGGVAADSGGGVAGAAAPAPEDYTPWSTLFPPRWWMPGTFLTTTGETQGLYATASTGARDTLGWLGYGGTLTYRTDARFLGGSGSVSVNRWRTVGAVGASTAAWPFGDIVRAVPDPPGGGTTLPGIETTRRRYWERRTRAWASVGAPLDETRAWSAGWSGTWRSPLDPLPADAYHPAVPTRGYFSSVTAGWRSGIAISAPLAISPEDGRSLAVGVQATSSLLGSRTFDDTGATVPFDQLQATAEGRWFTPVPRLPNHVIAARLAGGASLGDRFRYGSFRLGGSFTEGGLTVVPTEWRMLRGFRPATASGEWYWLGSGEYRFPLARPDRGFGILPAFLRNVSGAAWVDAGDAFNAPDEASAASTLVGVGMELRAQVIVGWGVGLLGRLGYGFAAHGPGIPAGSPEGAYATLGSSF